MSQSPAVFNTSSPMKKKIIAAIVAVVVAHVGVLWAVSHMKMMELRPIEKKPLKVKFVKIKEPPKPEIPKPKEKPKPEPKKEVKEVKVVEKPLPPPPKKIPKVQQVKAETPKQVIQKTEPKVETKVESQVVTKTIEKVENPQPVKEVTKTQSAAAPSPKRVSVSGSGIQWSRSPRLSFTDEDLEHKTRLVSVYIEADEKGKVTTARITSSTGISALDERVLRAVRSGKFKPYMENGIAYPIRTEQPFEFNP
jgi:protein TonB